MDADIRRLDKLALWIIAYLIIISLVALVIGFLLLDIDSRIGRFFAVASIGFAGSAIAALTSCLDRYVTGFELENGTKEPKAASGETFNRRMSRWFIVRPFLGFIMAPVLIWGMSFFAKDPDQFTNSTETLGFTAFLGGLLAKSVVELIKNLFKNVFRA